MIQWPQGGSETPESVALILRNGGSQSPDRWLWEGRNNQSDKLLLHCDHSSISSPNTLIINNPRISGKKIFLQAPTLLGHFILPQKTICIYRRLKIWIISGTRHHLNTLNKHVSYIFFCGGINHIIHRPFRCSKNLIHYATYTAYKPSQYCSYYGTRYS